jgi:hypothetical protein
VANDSGIAGVFSGGGVLLGLLCSALTAVASAFEHRGRQCVVVLSAGTLIGAGKKGVNLPAGNPDLVQGARHVADDLFSAHAQ